MHKKKQQKENRRVRQLANKKKRKKVERYQDEATDLMTSPGHQRRDSRRAAEIIALGVVDEKYAEGIIKKMYKHGLDETTGVRNTCSVVNGLASIARVELEHRKLEIVEQTKLFPVAPVRAEQEPELVEEPLQIAFQETGVSGEELAQTLKELQDAGLVDSIIDQYGKDETNGSG